MSEVIFNIKGVMFRLNVYDTGFSLWNAADDLPLLDAANITENGQFFVSRALDQEAIKMRGTRKHDGIEFEIITKEG